MLQVNYVMCISIQKISRKMRSVNITPVNK
jgi:hypothetical protein